MLTFAKPANTNVVGSFALGTMVRNDGQPRIDFVVTMPRSIFQEKDYLNYRYFLKRAYYISCIASAIKSECNERFKMEFHYLNGNHLLPILVLQPLAVADSLSKWRIQIIPTTQQGIFVEHRLLPTKNCLRDNSSNVESNTSSCKPTPFYNSSILADSLMTAYMKLQHEALQSCPAFLDACLLGRTWLFQRGFDSRVERGGFGNFEWIAMAALLLQGGGPKNTPLFSQGYSSYQLFKAVLQYIATKDLAREPATIHGDLSLQNLKGSGLPYFIDGQRNHNILYKMTPWSYKLLQNDARVSLAGLSDQSLDQFEATFISKVDHYLTRYDAIIEIPKGTLSSNLDLKDSKMGLTHHCQSMYAILSKALNTRTRVISIHVPVIKPWSTSNPPFNGLDNEMITVGFVFDESNVNRTLDRGPSAEDTKEAASFHKFWGEKAELRRFKDGSIVESVIWPTNSSSSIFHSIVSFALSKHLGSEVEHSVRYIEDSFKRYFSSGAKVQRSNPEIFQAAITTLRDLEQEIRGLDDMPLHLRQIQPADSQLSYSSENIPFISESSNLPRTANVTIQFEGSARWPDDMDAVQRTKAAFLLKLGELLDQSTAGIICRIGLENGDCPLLNQAFLDVIFRNGEAFRLRIHHDREATLLDRRLKDKSILPHEKMDAGIALHNYKQMFISQPTHTLAMQSLSTRHSSFSSTVRLVKAWFSSHFLSTHFHESLIELFVARIYTQPYPWSVPCSAISGLLRTLILLSRWDWRNEPWIANLGSTNMTEPDVLAIQTRFQAWRKIDPELNRLVIFAASNVEADGAMWTDYAKPPKVVASRMTALARSAVHMVKEQGTRLNLDSIFSSSLTDYDFIIHINRDVADSKLAHSRRDDKKFKNLQLQLSSNVELTGYDPVHQFVSELQQAYGDTMILFYDKAKQGIIAGLWNPQTRRAWKLKLRFSSTPLGKADEINVNKEGILNEVARLGGDLIKNISDRGKH
jgi:U3 small nucleolar RNA-associated protein 22